jgi:hypothetical protein
MITEASCKTRDAEAAQREKDLEEFRRLYALLSERSKREIGAVCCIAVKRQTLSQPGRAVMASNS